MQEDVEVVKASEVLLESTQRLGERGVVVGVDRGREIGHLAEPADPDPEPMEAVHRRTTAGLPVRRSDLLVPEPLVVGEDSAEVRTRERAGP